MIKLFILGTTLFLIGSILLTMAVGQKIDPFFATLGVSLMFGGYTLGKGS